MTYTWDKYEFFKSLSSDEINIKTEENLKIFENVYLKNQVFKIKRYF